MKILHLVRNIEYEGGAEIFVRSLLKNMSDKLRIGLYCIEGTGQNASTLAELNVEVVDSPGSWFNPRTASKLKNFCKRERYGLVHTHLFNSDFVGGLMKLIFCELPVVSTKYCMSSRFTEDNSASEKLFIKPLCNGPLELLASFPIDEIYAVSSSVASRWNNLTLGTKRIHILPCSPHNPEDITPRTDYKRGNQFNIGSLARLVPEKGILEGLEVMTLLKEEAPEINWHIYGDGILLKDIERVIKERQLENVSVHRHVDNRSLLLNHLSKLDAYFHPSRSEGLSIAIQEAMLAGLPILSTNVGGSRDAIEDGISGLLCEPRDIKTMSKLLLILANQEDLREKLGTNAREFAIKKYDINFVTNSYIKRYEELLK